MFYRVVVVLGIHITAVDDGPLDVYMFAVAEIDKGLDQAKKPCEHARVQQSTERRSLRMLKIPRACLASYCRLLQWQLSTFIDSTLFSDGAYIRYLMSYRANVNELTMDGVLLQS